MGAYLPFTDLNMLTIKMTKMKNVFALLRVPSMRSLMDDIENYFKCLSFMSQRSCGETINQFSLDCVCVM